MPGPLPLRAPAGVALSLILAAGVAGCAAARPLPRAQAAAAQEAPHDAGGPPGGPPGGPSGAPSRSPSHAAEPAPGAATARRPPPRSATEAPAPAARPKGPASALLVGTWRPADAGTATDRRDASGDVALEFKADGTWTIAGASYRAAGTYRWVGADEIELAIVESNLASQVGSASRRRVRVDAVGLALAVEPHDGHGRAADVVVTRFRRAGGR